MHVGCDTAQARTILESAGEIAEVDKLVNLDRLALGGRSRRGDAVKSRQRIARVALQIKLHLDLRDRGNGEGQRELNQQLPDCSRFSSHGKQNKRCFKCKQRPRHSCTNSIAATATEAIVNLGFNSNIESVRQ